MWNMDYDGESLCSSSSGSDVSSGGPEHRTPVSKRKKNKVNKAKAVTSESEANTSTSTLASHLPEDVGPSASSSSLTSQTEASEKKVVSFRSETSLEQIYSFEEHEPPPSCWPVPTPSPSPPRSLFFCCCCCRRRQELPERTPDENGSNGTSNYDESDP